MHLKLYNTLTGKKDEFRPLQWRSESRVRASRRRVQMYVCGPTVYDFAHVGNARPVIVFDVLFRLLRHIYGQRHVRYIRNITDIDDKINARAAAEKISIRKLTARTAKQFHEDVSALLCLKPTREPRATNYVPRMISIIEKLLASGHAYEKDGHVLYAVSSKVDYGKLSKRPLDEMIAGARVEVAPYKANPLDFVLWKPSARPLPGWRSPWGRGRPGWHIECSAMSERWLGETFDIHGGGIDLVFPHHENEIAQSEAAHDNCPLASVWMHNGFLQVHGEKMSKSLGNFVTIREMMDGWGGQAWSGAAIRLAMLGVHYRQPMDWTVERLSEAQAELVRYARIWRNMIQHPNHSNNSLIASEPSREILDALLDDLNVPEALTRIRAQRAEIFGRGEDGPNIYQRSRELMSNLYFLGVLNEHILPTLTDDYLKNVDALPSYVEYAQISKLKDIPVYVANGDIQMVTSVSQSFRAMGVTLRISPDRVDVFNETGQATVRSLIEARDVAKRDRNFSEADRIRNELLEKGIVLKDGIDGKTVAELKR